MNKYLEQFTTKLYRTMFKANKYSPEILMGVGVVGIITGSILACKSTLKVNDIVDEHKDAIEEIHKATENGITMAGESYSLDDAKKDTTVLYIQTGIKMCKLYAPAVFIETMSILSVLKSNNIMKGRYMASAAAYAILDKEFKTYRSRVVDTFGSEIDKKLKYGTETKVIDETEVDENGKEKVVKKMVRTLDPNKIQIEARYFDESCIGWTPDPEYNLMFLKAQQNYANDILKVRGHLFLNEVYDMLGMKRTKAGNIVGWVYKKDNENGDNYVDFRIYDAFNSESRDFVNGNSRIVLVDPNVDGNIIELID